MSWFDMLHTSLRLNGPAFIRYPRGAGAGVEIKKEPAILEVGRAEILESGSDIAIWALGPMLAEADRIAARLAQEEGLSVGVVNARFVKPLDRALLLGQAAVVPFLVTMEDHVLAGGFGSAVLEALQESGCRTAIESALVGPINSSSTPRARTICAPLTAWPPEISTAAFSTVGAGSAPGEPKPESDLPDICHQDRCGRHGSGFVARSRRLGFRFAAPISPPRSLATWRRALRRPGRFMPAWH